MSRPKLTEQQRQTLRVLVAFQRAAGEELSFSHLIDTVYARADPRGEESDTKLQADAGTLHALGTRGYIELKERATEEPGPFQTIVHHWLDFVLTHDGLDYADHWRKPRLVRWLIYTWEEWKPEWRSAMVAGVVSLVVSILAIIMSKALGY